MALAGNNRKKDNTMETSQLLDEGGGLMPW